MAELRQLLVHVFTKEPFSGHGWVDERWETSVRVAGLGKTDGGGTCDDLD